MKLWTWLKRLWRSLQRRDKVMYIGGSDTLPPPLPREQEAVLLERLNDGDFQVRQTLIERNLRLVVYIARRFENTGIHIEDLISIGTIGLIKAINTFRTDKNIKLATYASRCIENEILMYLRRNNKVKLEVSFHAPHRGGRGSAAFADGGVAPQSPGAGHHHHAVRAGRREGADAEGGGRPAGHLPELYLPAGEADHPAAAARLAENELKRL